LRRPMILDLDDATYIDAVSPVYGRLASPLKWRGKTDALIRRANVVTCGNETIAAHVGAKAVVVPTVVDLRVFRPGPKNDGVPVIGWIGTHSTQPYFERLLPVLERLARETAFQVKVVGGENWSLAREPDDFRALDIGVYPIADDAWSAGKSGLKAVQYMASGVPFVMSPVGVCATMGIAGNTHFLATTDDEWLDALRRLVADRALRERMGAAGRAFAEAHYSLDKQADVLASLIRKVAGC
ncbi:MAG TPA: glycosyltransferase family 4 protein, partial [Thermoanaerobaculia bacterium]|nr:glycosyltransferase family 4 protein [Thermoanaerobaculia bacterium]